MPVVIWPELRAAAARSSVFSRSKSAMGKRFKLSQPPIEMWTLGTNAREADIKDGTHSQKRLLVTWHESLDAFGRRSVRRIVDLFGRRKLIPDFSKAGLQVAA
jgi:hypothetical protein